MDRRFLFVLPLVVFGVIAAYFAVGLTKDPSAIPSVLIDTPVPEFALPQDLDFVIVKGALALNLFAAERPSDAEVH